MSEVKSSACPCCGIAIAERPPELLGGLAHGKTRTLQVVMKEEGGDHLALFEYYLEYGMECVTTIRILTPEGNVEGPYFVPVKALAPFVDRFREELRDAEAKKRG